MRDDKLRENIGIYEGLMDDAGVLADIFIGNETIEEFNSAGEYEPLLRMIAEFHFDPGNTTLYNALIKKIKFTEKKVYDLRAHVDSNYKKAKFIYMKR
jgi:hypothetical protein